MHHFKAKGGTVFNFNSDLSGPVHVWGPVNRDGSGVERAGVWSPEGDLLEFVDWYRRTPGYGVDEEALGETLTEEERKHVRQGLSDAIVSTDEELAAVAKLLRLHDALQARVKELEAELERAEYNAMGDDL